MMNVFAGWDRQGRPGVVSGPISLQQAAMDAMRQWRYQPLGLTANRR
jgi:hypothetical protein